MDRHEGSTSDWVAAFGLGGGAAGTRFVSPREWPRFNSRVSLQRLTGLALAAVEAGRLRLDAEHGDELRRRQLSSMLHALALERRLLELAAVFDSAGIDFVVLKGPVLAHVVYPDPSWRPFLDIDVLVGGGGWKAALEVLAGAGFRRVLPEPRPGFDDRFGKAALHRDQAGLQLDLHRRLVLGPFGLRLQSEALFRHTDWFRLGGRPLRRLDDTALLVHACVHAALGSDPPRRLALRDIAEIDRRLQVDWDGFVELCSRWRLGAVARRAAVLVEHVLSIPVPALHEAVAAVPTKRREVEDLAAYTRPRRARGGIPLQTLRAIPSASGKLAFLRALMLPTPEFLAARAPGVPASYLRRWTVPLRWVGRAGSAD